MSNLHDSVAVRWGHIQGFLFPWMREELDPCTEALERLISVLDTIGLEAFVPPPPGGGRGRKPDDRRTLARACVATAVLCVPTTTALIERWAIDRSLRRLCGWETRRQVPSESTFSRAFTEFAQTELPERLHEALVQRTLGERVIGCVARDATEIEARERPAKKDDPPPPVPIRRGNGGAPGKARIGRRNPGVWSGRRRRASQTCWLNFRPIATSVPRRTAKDTRKAGPGTSYTSMWRMDSYRFAACSPRLPSMIARP